MEVSGELLERFSRTLHADSKTPQPGSVIVGGMNRLLTRTDRRMTRAARLARPTSCVATFFDRPRSLGRVVSIGRPL